MTGGSKSSILGRFIPALILFAALAGGCARNGRLEGNDLVVVLPGAAGDESKYNALRKSVSENQHSRTVRTFHWGMPLPLFMLNLQDEGVHRKAEEALAKELADWRARHPQGKLTLIGHSAGCGVILGSLRRADSQLNVHTVILIAPSVSPTYELTGALRQIAGCLHNFHSDGDSVWLGWRCSRFGSYDSVRTAAAGKIGFHLAELDEALCSKVVQHPWNSQWTALGNEGGHWGALARNFTQQVIAPLLNEQGFSPAAQK